MVAATRSFVTTYDGEPTLVKRGERFADDHPVAGEHPHSFVRLTDAALDRARCRLGPKITVRHPSPPEAGQNGPERQPDRGAGQTSRAEAPPDAPAPLAAEKGAGGERIARPGRQEPGIW